MSQLPFSFLEFNDLINKQYTHQENLSSSETKPKLKFEPNSNVARIQNSESQVLRTSGTQQEEKKVDIIQDIAKNFQGEQSLMPQREEKGKKKETTKRYTITEDQIEKTLEKKKKDKSKSAEDFTIEHAIKVIKEKDPESYIPILLPFEKDAPEQKTAKEELLATNENDSENLFIFQFPRQIPLNIPIQEQEKKQEIINEEPTFDKNGYLIKPEFKNVFQEIKPNTRLGKIKVYKSGKIKLDINGVLFDVIPGTHIKFKQEAAIIGKEDKNEAYLLGNVRDKKMIVVPEIEN